MSNDIWWKDDETYPRYPFDEHYCKIIEDHEKDIQRMREEHYKKYIGVDEEWNELYNKDINEQYYLESIGYQY